MVLKNHKLALNGNEVSFQSLLQIRDNQNDCSKYAQQNGCPIYRSTLEHTLRGGKSGARGKTTQFPLKLAWASTCHSLQGVTITSKLIAHGHAKIPKGMYYVMLSRCSSVDNLYIDDKVDLNKIHCDEKALEEKIQLDENSLAPSVKNESFDIFYINIRSFFKHQKDLLCDIYAQNSNCLCLVETWIDPSHSVDHDFTDKVFYAASKGKGKGCCALLPITCKVTNIETQDSFQLLTFVYDQIHVTLVYLSKDPDQDSLIHILDKIIPAAQSNCLVGDFNFSTDRRNKLTRYLKNMDLHQLITQPTHEEGGMIDHCYVSQDLQKKIELNCVFKYFSDHVAFQIKFKK